MSFLEPGIRNTFRARTDHKTLSEQPNLHLSPEERRVFGQLFSAADTDKLGVVTGEVAVKFFEKTKLAPDVLGEVGDKEGGLLRRFGLTARSSDMADRRQREQRPADSCGLWHRSSFDWLCSSRASNITGARFQA